MGRDLAGDREPSSPAVYVGLRIVPRHGLDPCLRICNYIDVYEVEFAPSVAVDLSKVRAFDRARIMNAIEELLTHEPTVPTRHRKLLPDLEPPFEMVPPIWELRVGEFRVFYDVAEEEKKVYVRAVRRKPPHKTTEETL